MVSIFLNSEIRTFVFRTNLSRVVFSTAVAEILHSKTLVYDQLMSPFAQFQFCWFPNSGKQQRLLRVPPRRQNLPSNDLKLTFCIWTKNLDRDHFHRNLLPKTKICYKLKIEFYSLFAICRLPGKRFTTLFS